jgi:Arc/MetJ-type ribon-helix-helix transcriptional regulator
MPGSFAYSFDRVSFKGRFDSRLEALRAAERALQESDDTPADAIYVARRVGIDPQTSGHADAVLADMRRRMVAADGDPNWLRFVNDQQHAELDEALRRTLESWLAKHNLLPAEEKFEHISEHPLPSASSNLDR